MITECVFFLFKLQIQLRKSAYVFSCWNLNEHSPFCAAIVNPKPADLYLSVAYLSKGINGCAQLSAVL